MYQKYDSDKSFGNASLIRISSMNVRVVLLYAAPYSKSAYTLAQKGIKQIFEHRRQNHSGECYSSEG